MSARRLTGGERLALAAPYAYLAVFFLAPFALIVKISLSRQALSIPPYEPVFDWAQGPAVWLDKARELGLIPQTTHVDEHGRPVYSLEQIAATLGTTVEELQRLNALHADEIQAMGGLYTGPVHPLQ